MRATVSGESRPLVVHGQSAGRLFERDPLHPFHHDDRILTDAAAAIEAREAAQWGQGAMGVVFGIECASTASASPSSPLSPSDRRKRLSANRSPRGLRA